MARLASLDRHGSACKLTTRLQGFGLAARRRDASAALDQRWHSLLAISTTAKARTRSRHGLSSVAHLCRLQTVGAAAPVAFTQAQGAH
jgi:hypothetical protein